MYKFNRMRNGMRCVWLAGLCALSFGSAFADVRVIDGDTLDVDGTRHRLHGIDAAERQQRCRGPDEVVWDCAGEATAALRDLVRNRKLECVEVPGTRDIGGRSISRCRVGRQDLGEALVRVGLAWAFTRYSTDYVDSESRARRDRMGIWSVPPDAEPNEAPWTWRARRREAIAQRPDPVSQDPECRIKGNISQSGRVYHLPGSRDWAATRINEGRGERWFCSEQEAIAAGWRAPRGG